MKCGNKFCFHGSFGSKAAAVKKEHLVHGFIRRVTLKRGGTRFLVLTGKAAGKA